MSIVATRHRRRTGSTLPASSSSTRRSGSTDSGHEPETFALSPPRLQRTARSDRRRADPGPGRGLRCGSRTCAGRSPVDAEIHVFNLTNPLQPEFVQALANFFQVRTTAFVQQPVRVLAEVIAVTDPASERVLAKKVDVGFQGDPEGTTVGFFANLLGLDRSVTGTFTAYPRR